MKTYYDPFNGDMVVSEAARTEVAVLLRALEALIGGRRFNLAFAQYADRIREILNLT